jgi:hypothetical protein
VKNCSAARLDVSATKQMHQIIIIIIIIITTTYAGVLWEKLKRSPGICRCTKDDNIKVDLKLVARAQTGLISTRM